MFAEKMLFRFAALSLVFLLKCGIPFSVADPGNDDINNILERAAKYCEKVKNAALYFVCEERIEEEILKQSYRTSSPVFRTPDRKDNHAYIYDYQLIKKDGGVEEHRTLLEEDGKKKLVKDAPLKTKLFYSLKSVYGPVGFLSKESQSLYSFKLQGEDEFLGRKAYILKFRPKSGEKIDRNYGTIWVDKENSSVLKIEMDQESLEGYESLKARAEKRKTRPILTARHEYGIEKNGIRFPSRTVFEESYVGPWVPKYRNSQVIIEYRNYRFFTVEVKID
jgi:hypothetical protein